MRALHFKLKQPPDPDSQRVSFVKRAFGQELPKQPGLRPLHPTQSHPDQVILQHPQHHHGKTNGEVSELLPGSTGPSPLPAAWLSPALVAKEKKGGRCGGGGVTHTHMTASEAPLRFYLKGSIASEFGVIWFCSDVLNPLWLNGS